MGYFTTNPRIGLPDIEQVDTTAQVAVGTIALCQDPLYGAGEVIYLPGVASVKQGSVVVYDSDNYTSANPPVLVGSTTLAPSTANLARPVAVAAATISAGYFGWFFITATTFVKKTGTRTTAVNVPLYLSATAGSASSLACAGKQIVGMRAIPATTVACTVSLVLAVFSRPFAQGAIT